jgi:hypothetical protein
MSLIRRLSKKTWLLWAKEFSLAICLIYALFYLASSLGLQFFVLSNRGMVEQTVSGNVLSGPLDLGVWGFAVFFVLFSIGYKLELNNFRKFYRSFSCAGLLILLCGLVVWVFLVVLGFFGIEYLVLISGLLLSLTFVFAPNLFGVGRLVLFLRIFCVGLLLVFFVELAGLFLFNVPVALGLNVGVLGLHWGGVELGFANLAYPFLPYVYLLFVLFGLGAFVFRVLPSCWLWLISKVKAGRFVDGLRGVFEFGESSSFVFGFLRGRLVVVLAVVVSAVVSCLFVVFTVLPQSNPTGMMVSVDSPDY